MLRPDGQQRSVAVVLGCRVGFDPRKNRNCRCGADHITGDGGVQQQQIEWASVDSEHSLWGRAEQHFAAVTGAICVRQRHVMT